MNAPDMPSGVPVSEPKAGASAASSARSVSGVYGSTGFHWVGNGFHVSTYFPREGISSMQTSPFVLMDYGPPREFPALTQGKRGVGFHPHRGFETVTLAWEGRVAHRDNAGHRGVIGPGDVQWMTAGAGVFHEEHHEAEFARRGGRMHMMQLWVNLPAKDKRANPAYQAITAEQIPTRPLARGGNVRIVAGEFDGARGPARTFTDIVMLDVTLRDGEQLRVPLPPSFNALLVVASGRVRAGREHGQTGDLVVFSHDGGAIDVVAEGESHLLVLAGAPIREPVVQYGPFVMNSPAEIRQAFLDVEQGKFGPIPDDA